VPLPLICGVPTNLYKYHLSRVFTDTTIDLAARRRVGEILCAAAPRAPDLMTAAEKMAEEAITAFDVIEYINSRPPDELTDKDKCSIVMCFQKIRAEYRNEKLLIFYVLEFWMLRDDKSVDELGFM
jgi:hypothetical protein